jgi:hypothetical protein
MPKWATNNYVSFPPKEEYEYTLGGLGVKVPWRKLSCGMSFVLPTTASAVEAARAFSPAASFFKYKLRIEEIIWQGMTALRVHRIE